MAAPALDVAVARDDGQRTHDRLTRLRLAPLMNDHSATILARLLERLARQPLTRGHELVLLELHVGPGLPVVEQRGLDFRHAGAVRIGFGRDVLASIARSFD